MRTSVRQPHAHLGNQEEEQLEHMQHTHLAHAAAATAATATATATATAATAGAGAAAGADRVWQARKVGISNVHRVAGTYLLATATPTEI